MLEEQKERPREELRDSKKTKDIYYYVDSNNGIDIKIREVFKKNNKLVHYPCNTKNGKSRYGEIKRIVYEEMPNPLPRGFKKHFTTGYGFTKVYNPIVYLIQEKYASISSIIISTKQPSSLGNNEAIFNWDDLEKNYDRIDVLLKQQTGEKNALAMAILSEIFPRKFKKEKLKYIEGSLNKYISETVENANKFSSEDVQAAFNLISIVTEEHKGIDTKKDFKNQRSNRRVLSGRNLRRIQEKISSGD